MSLIESIGFIVLLLCSVIGAAVIVWCAWVGARTLGKRLQFARDFTPDPVPIETLKES